MAHLQRLISLVASSLVVAGIAAGPVHAADADVVRATDWLGHTVKTRDGKDLGTVRDLGIDVTSDRVVYVVVSVGSFLIENNLIAVAPDALSRSDTDENVLLIDADPGALRDAKRFASGSKWPTGPDVLRAENAPRSPPPAPAETNAAEAAPGAPPIEGTATIESKSKTAHLSANERYIKENAPPPAPVKPAKPAAGGAAGSRPEPITKFDHLDKDGDGVLNRSEFAPVMTRTDVYSKIDTNADGVIERNEFDAYEKSHGGSDQ